MYTINIYCNITKEELFDDSKEPRKTKDTLSTFIDRGCEGKLVRYSNSNTCREELSRFIARTVTTAGLMKNPRYFLENNMMDLKGVGISIANKYSSQALNKVQQESLERFINHCLLLSSAKTQIKVTSKHIKMIGICLNPESFSAIYYIIRHARKTLNSSFDKSREKILTALIRELLSKAQKNGVYTTTLTCLYLWMMPTMKEGFEFTQPTLMDKYNGAASYMDKMFSYTKTVPRFFRLISFIDIFNKQLEKLTWGTQSYSGMPLAIQLAYIYVNKYGLSKKGISTFIKRKIDYGIL